MNTAYRPIAQYPDLYASTDGSIVHGGNGGRQCRRCRYISNQNGLPPLVRGRHVTPDQVRQIVELANSDLSNREVARIVQVSPQTVARHRSINIKKGL